jgi:hypothetical protein
MTTAHPDEPLAEAIWFALFCAWPGGGYEAGCDSVLAIAIGQPAWATEIREAFRDPRGLEGRLADDEH